MTIRPCSGPAPALATSLRPSRCFAWAKGVPLSDIFLSYAREDRDFAEHLAKALEDSGWSVWWDRRLEAGEVWDEVIASNIEVAKIVLVLWSPTSIKSRWVKNEARFADEKGKLVPVLVRSTPIPLEFRHRQTEDLTAWRRDPRHTAFRRLADTLATRLGPHAQWHLWPRAERPEASRWTSPASALGVICRAPWSCRTGWRLLRAYS
jgi:TIR domain